MAKSDQTPSRSKLATQRSPNAKKRAPIRTWACPLAIRGAAARRGGSTRRARPSPRPALRDAARLTRSRLASSKISRVLEEETHVYVLPFAQEHHS
jgi:hypothetical protein